MRRDQKKVPIFEIAMVTVSWLLIFCGMAQAETVRIGGTGSGLAAMKILAEAFSKSHPGISVKVMPSLGSCGGIAALEAGALDIALSARPLKQSERMPGIASEQYARTPFIFVVNRTVGKSDLSRQELVDIYDGKTTDWPDGSRLRLILRPENDVDTRLVRAISPAVERAERLAQKRPGMTVATTNQQASDAVSKVPGSMACSTLTEVLAEKRAVKVLSYNGVMPTVKNLSDGRYPLVKRLYLVTSSHSSQQVKDFVNFVRSPGGRALLAAAGNLSSTGAKER